MSDNNNNKPTEHMYAVVESLLGSYTTLLRNRLTREVPDKLVRQLEIGGDTLDYIEWTTALDLMDDATDYKWQCYIKDVRIVGNYVVFVIGVKVWFEELKDWLIRENVGTASLSHTDKGDPATNAYAMGLKRAIVAWGPGRELYKAPDYEPHRMATIEQINKILMFIAEKRIPEKYHDAIINLIKTGELTYERAQNAINKYAYDNAVENSTEPEPTPVEAPKDDEAVKAVPAENAE
jgi:hypothetical protein